MSKHPSPASVTVYLPHPVSGLELMMAVAAICNQNRANFWSLRLDDDYHVAQIGTTVTEKISVRVPGDGRIRTTQIYERVSVFASHWPNGSFVDDLAMKNIQEFARSLTQQLAATIDADS